MIRPRVLFLEPIWGFIFTLVPWLILTPILVQSEKASRFIISCLEVNVELNNFHIYTFSAFFLSIVAFIINRCTNKFNLLSKENYLPSFMVVIIGSIFLFNYNFNQVHLACLFYVVGLYWLCKIPKEGNAGLDLFNAGFFFFTTMFIEPKFLIVAPLNILLALIHRTFSIRQVLVFLSALVVLYVFFQELSLIVNNDWIYTSDLFRVIQNEEPFDLFFLNHAYILSVLQVVFLFFSLNRLFRIVSNRLKAVLRVFLFSLGLLSLVPLLDVYSSIYNPNGIFLMPFLVISLTINLMFFRSKWLTVINVLMSVLLLSLGHFKIGLLF